MTRLYCLAILPVFAIVAVLLAIAILAIVAVHITVEHIERFAVWMYRIAVRIVFAATSRI